MEKQLDWLYGTQHFGIKLGLENTRRLLDALPALVPPPLTIHVAGTNGKGSVCAFAEAILRRHGRRVGLFTSPHLRHFRERIQINRQAISDDELARDLAFIRSLVSSWDPHPTFFELSLAIAWRHFSEQQIDALVLETGMGGRLDASNAYAPVHASVITRVGLDHMHHLGDSLAKIAAEKAGIIKPGVPVVSAPQEPEVAEVLRRVAREKESALRFVEEVWPGPLSLAGRHQTQNASLALAAVEAAGLSLQRDEVEEALLSTDWAGRFQRLEGGRIILDGAHNPQAAEVLAETWRATYPGEKATLVFGAARDKAVAEVLRFLRPVSKRAIFVPIHSPRALQPAEMPACVSPSECAGSLAAGLNRARQWPDRILVTGSLFLIGEALGLLQGTSERRRQETQ